MNFSKAKNCPRLRIILTANYSPWSSYFGGGQLSTHNLALGMSRLGHDVHVVFSKTPLEKPHVPHGLPYRIHWALFCGVRSSRKMLFRPFVIWPVLRISEHLIKDSPYPVILHANGEEAAMVHRLKEKYRFGFIASPRYSSWPAALAAPSALSRKNRLLLWLTESKYLLQGSVLSHADRICPPSNWAGCEVQKIFDLPSEKISAVHNGVPVEFLKPGRSEKALTGPILYFGRLSQDKGVDLLLHAYQRLTCAKPPLWIAGKGEALGGLKRLANQLGIESDVRFLPWKTQEELAVLTAGARIVAAPSRVENFSLSLLSSMSVGVPVVSTRVGGTPELIRNRETGLLVEKENVEQLAGALTELLQNPAFAEEIGKKGAREIRNSRTWSHTCKEFENIYREVLDEITANKARMNGGPSDNAERSPLLAAKAV